MAPTAQTVTVVSSETTKSRAPARRTGGGGGGTGSAAPAPKPVSNPMEIDVRDGDAARLMTPEEKKRADLQTKLHPSVLAAVERLKDPKAIASPDESKFINNGKAEIQIFLTDKSDETMAKLKELGFEVVLDPKTAKMVIGRLPVEKLATLAELKFVRYVSPQMKN